MLDALGSDEGHAEVQAAATGAAAPRSVGVTPRRIEVQGTIEATVDGRRMTWYSVSGESGGRAYSSSSWFELPSGVRVVGVGGFSTDEPPLESFEWDASGAPASYGTYDGPVIALAIQLPAEGGGFTVSFPNAGGITAMSYQPTATFENVLSSSYMASEGTLSVNDVEISAGLASAQGRFSGTFRTLGGDQKAVITDGEFHVEGIPNVKTIRR
jgi:hypothetical protein